MRGCEEGRRPAPDRMSLIDGRRAVSQATRVWPLQYVRSLQQFYPIHSPQTGERTRSGQSSRRDGLLAATSNCAAAPKCPCRGDASSGQAIVAGRIVEAARLAVNSSEVLPQQPNANHPAHGTVPSSGVDEYI